MLHQSPIEQKMFTTPIDPTPKEITEACTIYVRE